MSPEWGVQVVLGHDADLAWALVCFLCCSAAFDLDLHRVVGVNIDRRHPNSGFVYLEEIGDE